MNYFEKKQWIRIAVCAVLVILAVLAMTGVFTGRKEIQYTPEAEATGEDTPAGGETQNAMLQAITLSMGNEADNSYVTDYLEQDPYLVNIYDGYGFAKDYGSARGHSYTLEDVQKDIFEAFMGSFNILGKLFNLNRKPDIRLANRILK